MNMQTLMVIFVHCFQTLQLMYYKYNRDRNSLFITNEKNKIQQQLCFFLGLNIGGTQVLQWTGDLQSHLIIIDIILQSDQD